MSSKDPSAMGEESDEKSALVPRLRFPEFREVSQWESKHLRIMGTFFRGLTYSADEVSQDGLLVLRSSNIQDGTLVLNKDLVFVNKPCPDDIKLRRGDIAICMSNGSKALVGKSAEFRGGCDSHLTVGAFCSIFRPSVEFAKLIFQTPKYSKFVSVAIGGGNINNLKNSDLEEFEHPIPRLQPEQQKIADCLSSLDELITAETQKLDALKTHKKGLMQQLFPREGETVPRLRFPEFREAGEWEEKLIEDFFDVGSSKRVLQEDWTTQGVPFYRTRELVSLSKNEPFGSEIFISEELFREISEKYGLPAEGDFLVSGVGTLGISYQVQAQDRFYFKDGNVLWFKLRGGIVSTFFKYCFEANEIQNQILAQASISTVGTYTIQNAKVTKFSCPTNTEEQQEIADCLSSLDDLIAVQSQRVDAFKTHKKGLMQQLFPVLDEVPA